MPMLIVTTNAWADAATVGGGGLVSLLLLLLAALSADLAIAAKMKAQTDGYLCDDFGLIDEESRRLMNKHSGRE
jgi:hypothetical protein